MTGEEVRPMTIDDFTSALRAVPFRPFIVVASGRREYRIDHPETAMRSRNGNTVDVPVNENACTILDVDQIEAITFPDVQHASSERDS
jgi:hypothetical protein